MDRNVIESKVADLPKSELGTIQEDEEIWEETDGGAHFKVTRHVMPTPDRREFFSISISGQPSERRRIIREFKEVFGVPAGGSLRLNDPMHIDVLTWYA